MQPGAVHQTQAVANFKLKIMYKNVLSTLKKAQSEIKISESRQKILQPLVDYIQQKTPAGLPINLNFICTHNSRRSHLAQIWAQIAAAYFQVPMVFCYSGGTEETALFPKVAETLAQQGLQVLKLSTDTNPIYAFKYSDNCTPVIGFSKKFDHPYNPNSNFAAIMTCSQADEGCPFVAGTEKRVPITFEDPKISDGTAEQTLIYTERSLQIAAEMMSVFAQLKKNN